MLIGSRITQEAHDINSIMFGTAVVVSPSDLRQLAWTGAIVMVLQTWWHRGFAATGVTEEFISGDTTPHYHASTDTAATVELAYTARAARLVTYVVARELGAD